jgi:hypothetical protein
MALALAGTDRSAVQLAARLAYRPGLRAIRPAAPTVLRWTTSSWSSGTTESGRTCRGARPGPASSHQGGTLSLWTHLRETVEWGGGRAIALPSAAWLLMLAAFLGTAFGAALLAAQAESTEVAACS